MAVVGRVLRHASPGSPWWSACSNLDLARALIGPFALMALPGALFGAWLWFKRQPAPAWLTAPQIGQPA